MIAYIISGLQTVVIGIFMFYFQRAQNRKDKARAEEAETRDKEARARDKETRKRGEARKHESLLMLDMMSANCKLTYAVAMAQKRGETNGETEDALEDYEKAKKKYYSFLNDQAKEHLQ